MENNNETNNKQKWYREPWLMFSLLATPLFFVGIILLLTDKKVSIFLKILFLVVWVCAVYVTLINTHLPAFDFLNPNSNTIELAPDDINAVQNLS